MTISSRGLCATLLLLALTLSSPLPSAGQTLSEKASAVKQHLVQRMNRLSPSSALVSLLDEKWHYVWDEVGYQLEGKTTFRYTDVNRTERWDFAWTGAAFVAQARTKMTTGGTRYTAILNEEWDEAASAFVPVDRYAFEFIYDLFTGEPSPASSLYQTWDGTAWQNVEQSTFSYVEIMVPSGGQTDVWDGAEWVPSTRYMLVQEDSDVIQTNQEWDGTEWVDVDRVFIAGTIDDLVKAGAALEAMLDDYEGLYYGLHAVPLTRTQEWNGIEWVDAQRATATYDFSTGFPVAIVYEAWSDGAWVPEYRFAVTYDDPGVVSTLDFDMYAEGEWSTFIHEAYERDVNGAITRADQNWNFGPGATSLTYYTMTWRHTGTSTEQEGIPASFELGPAYPNPFNPTTTLSYSLTKTGHVTIRVYDALGRSVATLADGVQTAGAHDVTFEAAGLPSGVYLVRLAAEGRALTRALTLLK